MSVRMAVESLRITTPSTAVGASEGLAGADWAGAAGAGAACVGAVWARPRVGGTITAAAARRANFSRKGDLNYKRRAIRCGRPRGLDRQP